MRLFLTLNDFLIGGYSASSGVIIGPALNELAVIDSVLVGLFPILAESLVVSFEPSFVPIVVFASWGVFADSVGWFYNITSPGKLGIASCT